MDHFQGAIPVPLLNSDTLLRGDVIAKSVQYLSENPDVGGMGFRVLNTDETVQFTCAMFPSMFNLFLQLTGLWKLPWPKFLGRYLMTHWQRDSTRPVETISGCYLLVWTEIIETVGPLDEAFFFFGEETDCCKRIRDAGRRLDFAPVGTIIHHGSASVHQLNYKRDLLLSDATVRLHYKHNGWLSAFVVSLMILAFHALRAVYWSVVNLILPSTQAKQKATNYLKLLGAGGTVWPRKSTTPYDARS